MIVDDGFDPVWFISVYVYMQVCFLSNKSRQCWLKKINYHLSKVGQMAFHVH